MENKIFNKDKDLKAKEEINQLPSFSYYSNVLNKPFDSLDKLKAAEIEYQVVEAKKKAEALAKKNECNIVNASIDAYEAGKQVCNEAIAKAYTEYKAKVAEAEKSLAELEKDASEKLSKWLKDHPGQGFHYTYKSEDGKVTREYNYYNNRYNVFDKYNEFVELLDKLWI